MIESTHLSSISGIAHGFFTREGGVSDGIYKSLNIGVGSKDSIENIIENRSRICQKLGCNHQSLVTPHQTHSVEVVTVKNVWSEKNTPKADALVINQPNIAIGVSTADCGPVLLADRRTGVIGAAHAGWRGALGGIIEATIVAMETLGAIRSSMVGVLGPTISMQSYEVGQDFAERFLSSDANNKKFFRPSQKPEHFLFDLASYIVVRLKSSQIGTVSDLGICTYLNEDRFFSYRRTTHRAEADYGRQLSAITIKEDS